MTFVNFLKGYRYEYAETARKQLKHLDKKIVALVDEKLQDLVTGKQNLPIRRLVGQEAPRYRLRVGDYRVIYEVYENKILVIVVAVGHRKNVYEKM
jgi:mRNA interferase RelE/StbE